MATTERLETIRALAHRMSAEIEWGTFIALEQRQRDEMTGVIAELAAQADAQQELRKRVDVMIADFPAGVDFPSWVRDCDLAAGMVCAAFKGLLKSLYTDALCQRLFSTPIALKFAGQPNPLIQTGLAIGTNVNLATMDAQRRRAQMGMPQFDMQDRTNRND